MKARVLQKGKDSLLNYELPHRVHTSKAYPVKAPNGSSIFLYGHTNGVRICWRGGRALKKTETPSKSSLVNGASSSGDAIVLSDSEDDAKKKRSRKTTTAPIPIEASFESEDEELDPANPFPSIVQSIDLALNTEVLHISTPPALLSTAQRNSEHTPPILEKNMVFAVACADSTVRLVSLPKAPPSDERKSIRKLGRSETRWGEEILTIGSLSGHQNIPLGVAMTWTARTSSTIPEGEEDDVDMIGAGDENDTNGRPANNTPLDFDFLLTSHSDEATGLLLVFRIPIVASKASWSITSTAASPCQIQYLTSPAKSVSFSPSCYPNKRHSQLLVTDPKGCVRVYDMLATRRSRRRGSVQDAVSNDTATPTGSWIASFATSFESPKRLDSIAPTIVQRKAILDAQWATGGRSVIILLSDGEWGVWDINSSAPSASRLSSKSNQKDSGFAISGFVGASSTLTEPKAMTKSRGLAPMTPNTRRSKEDNLLHGASSTSSMSIAAPATATRGGIAVASLPSQSGGIPEDSVILWYGNEIFRIPNLAQFWSRSAGGNSGGLYGPGMSKVEDIDLQGEMISGIDQFDISIAAARVAIPRDLLVAAEHRLLILTRAIDRRQAQAAEDSAAALFGGGLSQTTRPETSTTIPSMFQRRQLNLAGIDRALEDMNEDDTQTTPVPSRKVGFAA